MTCFDEEPNHQPDKDDWHAYEMRVKLAALLNDPATELAVAKEIASYPHIQVTIDAQDAIAAIKRIAGIDEAFRRMKKPNPTPKQTNASLANGLVNAYADFRRLHDEYSRLREATANLIGYSITARSHSREWLVDMASYINLAAEAMDDPDRAMLADDGEHLAVRKAAV